MDNQAKFRKMCFDNLDAAKEMYEQHGVSVLFRCGELFARLCAASKLEAAEWIRTIKPLEQKNINHALWIVCQSSTANVETCDYLFNLGAIVDETIMMLVNLVPIADWLMCHFNYEPEKLHNLYLFHRATDLENDYNFAMAVWLLKNVYDKYDDEYDRPEVTDLMIIKAIEDGQQEFVKLCILMNKWPQTDV